MKRRYTTIVGATLPIPGLDAVWENHTPGPSVHLAFVPVLIARLVIPAIGITGNGEASR